jgi:hypothetical protein
MKIEVLYVPNCPNHAVALERLREVLSAESFQKHVIEPQSEKTSVFGLMCRLYPDGSGAPSEQRLRAAIEKAGA